MSISKLFTAALRRPSQRTLYEAQLTGMTIILLSSLITPFYTIFFTDLSLWLKILTSAGSIGICLFISSNLATTYIQYYTFKTQMGLYPKDYMLQQKIDDAKYIIQELNELVEEYGSIQEE
jgi:hypothetical protein